MKFEVNVKTWMKGCCGGVKQLVEFKEHIHALNSSLAVKEMENRYGYGCVVGKPIEVTNGENHA